MTRTENLTFEDQTAAEEFFAALTHTRLPVRIQDTRAAYGYDDDGRPIITFARKLFGQPETGVEYSLTEVVRHGR